MQEFFYSLKNGVPGSRYYQKLQNGSILSGDSERTEGVCQTYKFGSPEYQKYLKTAKDVTSHTRGEFADGDCSRDSHYFYDRCEAFMAAVDSQQERLATGHH